MAGGIVKGYIQETLQREEELQKLDLILELAVESIVRDTTEQLCGDKHLETDLKKSLAPQSQQQANNAVAAAISAAVGPAQLS